MKNHLSAALRMSAPALLCVPLLAVAPRASDAQASARRRAPRFEDYPVREVYKGRNAPVRLTRDDRLFRTRLRDAARQRPNFAGHYVVAYWGCGTECVAGAAVDVKTGRVVWFPGTICCWLTVGEPMEEGFEPVTFRLDSRLIVFKGARNERDGDVGTHFYIIERGRLVHLKSIPKEGQER